jgi:hypothetical protein
MSIWYVEHNSVIQASDVWGIESISRSLVSQGVDHLLLTMPVDGIDDTPLFNLGDRVILHRENAQGVKVRYFTGTVQEQPGDAAEGAERLSYTIKGPWFDLEQCKFQQSMAYYGAGDQYVKGYSSHYFLGQTIHWPTPEELIINPNMMPTQVYAGTRDIIFEVIDWAQSCGAYLNADLTGIPNFAIPIREDRDLTCAEVIQRVLRWIPDIVAWFDYSTTIPTLKFSKRTSLTAFNLAFDDKIIRTIGKISPRYDLVPSAVIISYELTVTNNNVPCMQLIKDIAPLHASENQLYTLTMTVDLKGYTRNMVYGVIESANFDITSLTWWKTKHRQLASDRYDQSTGIQLDITTATRTLSPSLYPFEVVGGSWAQWMPCRFAQDTVKIKAKLQTKGEDGSLSAIRYEDLVADIMVTNSHLPNGNPGKVTYSTLESYDSGETVPSGLAQTIYDSLKDLQYSGSIELQEDEVGDWLTSKSILDRYSIGCALNITGSKRTEWATMNAVIQQVTENLMNGTTSITIGPAEHLTINDIIDLMRLNRTRYTFVNPLTQATGKLDGSGTTRMPDDIKRDSSNVGADMSPEYIRVYQELKQILIDASQTSPLVQVFKNPSGQNTDKYVKMQTTGGDLLSLPQLKHGLLKTGESYSAFDAFVQAKDGDASFHISTADCKCLASGVPKDLLVKLRFVPICIDDHDYLILLLCGDWIVRKNEDGSYTWVQLPDLTPTS